MTAGTKADPKLVQVIEECLRKPVFFRDIIDATKDRRYRSVLQAWGDVRSRLTLERDEHGRYWSAQPKRQAAE